MSAMVLYFIIFFLLVSTVTAARIFKGQVLDHLQFGEEAELYMESLPFTGFSKVSKRRLDMQIRLVSGLCKIPF